MRLLFTVSVAILACAADAQLSSSYRNFTTGEVTAAGGTEANKDVYSAYNSFKFGPQSSNYDTSLDDTPSPGFETLTGARFKPWNDTWSGTGDGSYEDRKHQDITKKKTTSVLDTSDPGTPKWDFPGSPNKSGTLDFVMDDEELPSKAVRWATKWAQDKTYRRDDYDVKGEEMTLGAYPLASKSDEAVYRQHHAELHQNGPVHYSPGLFPELSLDETHRYFMDGEAWPRTEKEYRYSFKTWGNDYRAGTLVSEMNLGDGDDVHKYHFGQNYSNTTGPLVSKGNQPDLFADAPNGGDQEVYTPRLDFSWTHNKYTALDATTENTYQEYIDGRARLNGSDGNTVVEWGWDRSPKKAQDGSEIVYDGNGWLVDMSVTSEEEKWNKINSGEWAWWPESPGYDPNKTYSMFSGLETTAGHGRKFNGKWNGPQEVPAVDNRGTAGFNHHKHVVSKPYAVGPNGLALTTAVGDKYGWNTNLHYGYGKLDTFRTWNMNGRKV